MTKKTQKFEQWQGAEAESLKDKQERKIWEESQKKRDQADLEANSYQVRKDGQIVFESHYENEAIRTAEKINAQVIWCIESCGIRQIYPKINT